jgi:hypothetical protein|tara:strand:+ start:500 stop:748 length:249 start_codon:yes stop_codon:yes gene_type:complete
MAKKYIHVNQHVIRANKKNNENNPVITIKEGKKNTYCHEVEILGNSKITYSGNEKTALSCGARVVIETQADLIIDGVHSNET